MGDKPVPSMLKKLLTVDAAERWSCKEALESPQGRAGWPGIGAWATSHPAVAPPLGREVHSTQAATFELTVIFARMHAELAGYCTPMMDQRTNDTTAAMRHEEIELRPC